MKKLTQRQVKDLLLSVIVVLAGILGVVVLTGGTEKLKRVLAGILLIFTSLFASMGLIESDNPVNMNPGIGDELVEVIRVVDGDSIIIERDIEVRLIGINAPESGECYFEESRQGLTNLIQGKKVYLKKDISGKDDFGRLLRYVFLPSNNEYQDEIFVNRYVLEEGLADIRPLSQDREYRRLLTSSRNQALTSLKGMWGECEGLKEEAESFYLSEAESDNPTENPNCLIKGNVSQHGLGKTYFPPGCSNYNKVKIDFSKGETYFCTEEEAIEQGFVKSGSCQ